MPERKWDWNALPEEYEKVLTSVQVAVIKHLQSGLSYGQAGKVLDVDRNNVFETQKRAQATLRRHGVDLTRDTTYVPPPHYLKGKSTLYKYDENGVATKAIEWIKTDKDAERKENAVLESVKCALSQFKPFPKVKKPVHKSSQNDLTVYTLTDFHLGMYAWAPETGGDWDMNIAENVLLNAFAEMLEGSPDSEVGIFAQLGDLMHWDGLLALTPTAKNVLDADTRFPLLVQTAISVLLKAAEMMLHKHNQVHIIMAEGNHDMASSVWLQAIMAHVFGSNPRVTVDQSAFPFYAYQWGDVFLAWHHGHLQKMENLPLLFATDPRFREMFGKCKYTYVHTGHKHQKEVIEKGGIHVEQHPTLAQRDAHGARGFLYSQRGATAITYDKSTGERSRITVRPNQQEFAA